MAETMSSHYPLALERIVRGFTRVTLNPATILISLDNQHVDAGWLVKEGSRLENYGSTHGALDDINSDGIVLSNFKPTRDTSSDRVARTVRWFSRNAQLSSGGKWPRMGCQKRTGTDKDRARPIRPGLQIAADGQCFPADLVAAIGTI